MYMYITEGSPRIMPSSGIQREMPPAALAT